MKPKLKHIEDQVAVILGGTSGIGLETALLLAEKGAQVAIVGRSQEGLNDALERVRAHAEASRMVRGRTNGSNVAASDFANVEAGGAPVAQVEEQVIALEADATNFDQIKSVADQVMTRFGRIDTWVNVAAVAEWALFEDTSPEEFRRIIDVNLIGQAYGAMAAIPYMKQNNGGAIIFVSSIAGRLPIPYQTAYVASKHGVLGLADTLRLEMKHTHTPISITAILPASINTPLFDKSRTKIGVEPAPIPPVYDARMVANAILFAAEHPARELIVGDAGYAITFMRRLAPTLTANYMGASGFRQQRSDEPKSAQAPDNLYHHMSGYDQVQSNNQYMTKPISPLTWLSTHPKARLAIFGVLGGAVVGLISWRVIKARNDRMKDWRYMLPYRAKKMAKQAKRMSKQADKLGKRAGKAAREYSSVMAGWPVVSSLPMFQRKSWIERSGDNIMGALGNTWEAITALVLAIPFLPKQKSMPRRMVDRVVDILPTSRPRPVKYVVYQGKSAADFVAGKGKDAASFVVDRSKDAAKFANRRSKDTVKMVSKSSKNAADFVADSSQDMADMVSKRSRKAAKKAAKQAAGAAEDMVATSKDLRKQARWGRRQAQKAIDSMPAVEVEVRDKRTGERLTLNK